MRRACAGLALLMVMLGQVYADENTIATNTGTAVIQSLKTFKPADIIPDYNPEPKEAQMNRMEENEAPALVAAGAARAREEATARDVLMHAKTRDRATFNPNAAEMEYAEHLLENPDAVLAANCHKEPVPCEEIVSEKSCEDTLTFDTKTCTKQLKVGLHREVHPSVMRVFVQNLPLDLTSCGALNGTLCGASQLTTLNARCEHLTVKVSFQGKSMPLTQQPSCDSPQISVAFPTGVGLIRASVEVVEHWSEPDAWSQEACEGLIKTSLPSQCQVDSTNACLDKGATHVIDGVPITRACWGSERVYQCESQMSTTCTPWIEAGCMRTSSHCTAFSNETCAINAQTYQCTEKRCFPDKEVCTSPIACADGACDESQLEESDDVNEGLSRLGALGGTAEAAGADETQLKNHAAFIFAGTPDECESYPIGIRDCCKDEGFLDGSFIVLPACKPCSELNRRVVLCH